MSTYDPDHYSQEKFKKTERRIFIIYSLAVIISVIGAYLMAKSDWITVTFKEGLAENWNDLFLKYVFIVVAVERAASVFVGIDRSPNNRKWEKRVRRVREILEKDRDKISVSELYKIYEREKQIIDDFSGQKGFLGITEPILEKDDSTKVIKEIASNKNELLAYLQATKNVYEFKAAAYTQKTNTILTRFVFIGGIIISVVGLSIFNDILNVDVIQTAASGEFSYQLFFYRFIDVVVTGGLLGGGSKSFSVFIETLNKTLERVKDPKGTD